MLAAIKKGAPAIWLMAASLSAFSAFGCEQMGLAGTLLGRFSDGVWTFRQRVDILPDERGGQFTIPLKRSQQTCRLVLFLPPLPPDPPSNCDMQPYKGQLTCADGRELALTWKMTANRGGYGYSTHQEDPYFVFSVGRYVDGALDVLEKAKVEYQAQF